LTKDASTIAVVSPRTSVAFREILWEPLTESLGTSNARLPQEEENGDPICDKNRFCMYTSREYESAEDERLSRSRIVFSVEARGWPSISRDAFPPECTDILTDKSRSTDNGCCVIFSSSPFLSRCARFRRMIVRISINLRKTNTDLITETIVVTVRGRTDG